MKACPRRPGRSTATSHVNQTILACVEVKPAYASDICVVARWVAVFRESAITAESNKCQSHKYMRIGNAHLSGQRPVYMRLIMSCKFLILVFMCHYVPWIVQLFEGPVVGSVSQNYMHKCSILSHDAYHHRNDRQLTCVCNRRPPGASKQHKSVSRVVLWHDAAPEVLHPELTRLKRSSGPTGVTPVEGRAKEGPTRASAAAMASIVTAL